MPLRLTQHQAKAYGLAISKPQTVSPRQRYGGYASSWEREYADILETQRAHRELRRWQYESITLRLAIKATYTPDFLIENWDGSLEFHEVKGFQRPVGMLKLKVAARQFLMFRFLLVTKANGLWDLQDMRS